MRKIFKISLYIIVLIAISLTISLLFRDDPGYVLVTGSTPFGEFSFESTILTGLLGGTLALFAFYYGLRFLVSIFNLPSTMKHIVDRYKQHSSDKKYARAQLAIMENKFVLAEDLYISSIKGSIHPRLCYVGAAKAAHLQGSANKRDHYLAQVDEVPEDRDTAFLANIQRAEILFDAHDYPKAQKALESLATDEANNPHILTLLAQTYQHQADFKKLIDLLPRLNRLFTKTHTKVSTDLALSLYRDTLQYASSQKDHYLLKDIWNNIPKELRLISDLIITQSQHLLNSDNPDDAEALLRQALKKQFDESLVNAYGHLYRGNLKAQIKFANSILDGHPESAYAHIAVARLEIRNEDFNRATDLILKSLKIKALPEALELLAEIKQHQGDMAGALGAYQQLHRLNSPHFKLVQGDVLPVSTDEQSENDGTKLIEAETQNPETK